MRESAIQTAIRLAIGARPEVLVQRRHVGTYLAVSGNISAAAQMLRSCGFVVAVVPIGTPGEADLQGIIGNQTCTCGKPSHPLPFALEVKTDKGKQSPDQVNWQTNIWERRGGLYAIARSPADALTALRLTP